MKIKKIVLLTIVSILLVGCSSSKYEEMSGTLSIAGSSAMQPLVEKTSKLYMEKNSESFISVQGGGSGTGLTQVFQGAIDIGNSDIDAKEKFKNIPNNLYDYKICVVAFVPVVNIKNKIDNLSKADLKNIFTGKITNWKDVGGDDSRIVVINRPKSSGTRLTFKKYALDLKEEVEGEALVEDSSGAVRKTIEESEGAIGYLASSYTIDKENLGSLKPLSIDGFKMNKENVINGKYSIASYEHMYTKNEASGISKKFIDYILSDEISELIEKLGYFSIKDMKIIIK